MDFSKLKEVIKERGIPLTVIAREIGMSNVGLYNAIDKGSLKARDLKSICDFIGVPAHQFFNEAPTAETSGKFIEERLADLEKEVRILKKGAK